MFTATLQPPLKRLNMGDGLMFMTNVPKPVSYELAKKLEGNKRFVVTGLNTKEALEAAELETRPTGDDLLEAIRDASAELDLDDESNFDRSGKPDHRSLGEKLGYPVTPEERDRALGYDKQKRVMAKGQLETAEGKVEPTAPSTAAPLRAGSIVLKKPKTQPEPKAPNPDQADSGIDPTTKGAVAA